MTKCKWCEKETPNNLEFFPNVKYCGHDCHVMYDTYEMRKIIYEFAQAMEKEMQEKDNKGYTYEDKSLEFLVNKLKEERNEVDFELIDLPSFEINKELLHEAIMTMLVKYKMKNLTKEDLK